MADEPDTGNSKGPSRSSNFGFLTKKVGPLPVWAYAAIAIGAYYWYTHYGPGAQKAQQAQAQQAATDQATGRPYAQEYGQAVERVNILESEKRTGVGKMRQDHDRAKDKKVNPGGPVEYGPMEPAVNPGGPEQSGVNPGGPEQSGVNPGGPRKPGEKRIGITIPPGQNGHRPPEDRQHVDVSTRWRGPYDRREHPHEVAKDDRPTTKPAHRPLGV